ncbi:hypothetical protein PMZ80_001369 [Knufia obscura]|uniref:Uncharacterized protein n=1 Tax=Knufia obscura TaxID=1635080 RepID=A0ABR0S327_9EURO|nr:hypothetical protein PMZ80_001369 [Knufia obscura]
MPSPTPAECTLMGQPPEIRLMILRELLCCDEVLADIPTIVATPGDSDTVIRRDSDDIREYDLSRPAYDGDETSEDGDNWGANIEDEHEYEAFFHSKLMADSGTALDGISTCLEVEDIEDKFASRRRFKLYPEILLVCRQLYNEGYDLLYDDKTIGVSFLRSFDDVLKGYGPEYSQRSYCMGKESVEVALTTWPALRGFKNWAYTIYVGPYADLDPLNEAEKWAGRNLDLYSLYTLPIDRFTISLYNASSNHASLKRSFVKDCIMPFHTHTCKILDLEGDVGQDVAGLLRKYMLQKPLKTEPEMIAMVLDLVRSFRRRYRACLGRFDGELQANLLSVAGQAKDTMELTMKYWRVDCFYEIVKTTIEWAYEELEMFPQRCKVVEKDNGLDHPDIVQKAIEELRLEVEEIEAWCADIE